MNSSPKKRGAKLPIVVPDHLYDRMQGMLEPPDWNQIACDAFENHMDDLERKEVLDKIILLFENVKFVIK